MCQSQPLLSTSTSADAEEGEDEDEGVMQCLTKTDVFKAKSVVSFLKLQVRDVRN